METDMVLQKERIITTFKSGSGCSQNSNLCRGPRTSTCLCHRGYLGPYSVKLCTSRSFSLDIKLHLSLFLVIHIHNIIIPGQLNDELTFEIFGKQQYSIIHKLSGLWGEFSSQLCPQ